MGKLIIDPSESPIQQPFDQYWDNPMTRREARVFFRQIAFNTDELMGMADTAALMLNFIFEKKLGGKTPEDLATLRQEIDAYVEVKKAQLEARRAQMKAEAELNKSLASSPEALAAVATEAADEQLNS